MDALPFAVCAGAVTGRDHARANRNAQDACGVHVSKEGIVLAVADGCSSGASTEVGATLAVRWLARNAGRIGRGEGDEARAAAIGQALIAYLRAVAEGLCDGEGRAETVHDLLLFSFLAAVVDEKRAIVIGAGDGVFAVNGEETVLDPGPENAPDYLGYALLVDGAPARDAVRVHRACATRELASIVLATDGALDLIRTAAEPIDGAAQGGLDQFTRDLRYARNPSLVKKRLTVIGALHGRLHDDTAIALLTRRGA